MAAVLASYSCCCRIGELAYRGRVQVDLSFSGLLSHNSYADFDKDVYNLAKARKFYRFQVRMQQTELPTKVGTNGRATKMLPATEVKKRISPSISTTDNVNGSPKNVNGVRVVNGGRSLVKRDPAPPLSKTSTTKELPPIEDLKVLPSDEGERRRRTASWLRECVLQLGPTFIKLGQLSSTRSDLFPKEFVDELAKLQDRVPAFSPSKAKKFVENELGAPIRMLFKEFEDLPIAAASLGQVHRAILHNGEKVVVKVQRPGLKKLFDIDLKNLKLIAEYFQRSETLGGPTRDWIGIYEECAKILYEEIDYVNEGKNADRFRRDFRNIKWVRVPMVYWDYTATKVLTLEYAPGIKINQLDMIDARGYSRANISSRAIEAYLIQILKTGFFHADPHPGNLAIDVDEALIYYDFGMMGEIKSFTKERLLEVFYAVYEKDAKKVMQGLIDLGALQPTGDMTSVRRSVQFFLDNLLNQRPDQQQTLSAIGEDLFAIATDQPFRFPSTFTFVLRAFSTLEGIGYTLNPEFSFPKIAAPYAQELLDLRQQQRTRTIVQEIRKQADDARSSTISMPYRIQRIEDIVKQLESGDLKLRVRVLEDYTFESMQHERKLKHLHFQSERAARKATVLQMATIYTVAGGTLLNLGVTFSNQGSEAIANGSFVAAGVFFTLFIRSMQRVSRLDKFEKMI
ncbi:protein ACTIVITY OF BC1 COMPLEX kinase, chloroplastic [Sesamum angolense]|uniref:Protein ACTIVITY OF BC1 COMPLEX kinase, chloroplastic n=1 Tax=Sesamum angolense TaxID=2727404 RepID=A0AAE1WQG4_9LAMI|nr:protein ACTIVITY OF BC1 COMPLEX kinase, chloroplastic [Sesamum angolense]